MKIRVDPRIAVDMPTEHRGYLYCRTWAEAIEIAGVLAGVITA